MTIKTAEANGAPRILSKFDQEKFQQLKDGLWSFLEIAITAIYNGQFRSILSTAPALDGTLDATL